MNGSQVKAPQSELYKRVCVCVYVCSEGNAIELISYMQLFWGNHLIMHLMIHMLSVCVYFQEHLVKDVRI